MSSEFVQVTLTILLFAVFFCVMLLPFFVKRVERELELFLFAMGGGAMVIDTAITLLFPNGSGTEVPRLDIELV